MEGFCVRLSIGKWTLKVPQHGTFDVHIPIDKGVKWFVTGAYSR